MDSSRGSSSSFWIKCDCQCNREWNAWSDLRNLASHLPFKSCIRTQVIWTTWRNDTHPYARYTDIRELASCHSIGRLIPPIYLRPRSTRNDANVFCHSFSHHLWIRVLPIFLCQESDTRDEVNKSCNRGGGKIDSIIRLCHIRDQSSRVLSLRTTQFVGYSVQGIHLDLRYLPIMISRS
jgi:hypothetical protein